MLSLDEYVDALEDEVADKGVLAIDLKRLAPALDKAGRERTGILIEMLRVWMEHRWRAGEPVTVGDCLNEFPDDKFSEDELASLRFEEQRLRQTAEKISDAKARGWSVDALPEVGAMWGEFELLSVLGVGAFAKVYLARQHGLAGRLVAIKLTFRETHESQWLATLQHSAIVPIYSTHRRDDVYGICMPFLGNSTLADLLLETPKATTTSRNNWWSKSRRRLSSGGGALLSTIQQRHGQIDTVVKTVDKETATDSDPGSQANADHSAKPVYSSASEKLSECDYVEAICWIAAQLADALSYAHRNGVVHSDIKPANILLAFDGQPRLLDFNVSYQSSESGVVEEELPLGGTIPYMSPEHRQAFKRASVVDARSDLYSLGVVIFEMLTGKLPGDREASEADPSKWNAAVSPAMSAIVRKCLKQDPAERYQSADELRDDLTAQFHHEPLVHQPEPSTTERMLKWSHRHPRLSSSVSIAALASLLISVLAFGVVARQIALNRAEWVHRMDQLKERLPNSMAMLTSLNAVPELEPDVAADLEETFALIRAVSAPDAKIDPRWTSHTDVSDDLYSELRQIAWLSSQRKWKKPPAIPDGLDRVEATQEEKSREEEKRSPLSLIQQRKFIDAMAMLKKRVSENPRDYGSWWLLGDCYHEMFDFGNAQNAYTVCVALQPKSAIGYLNRGMARLSSNAFDLAAQDYADACRLAPTWQLGRLNRAIALQQLGRIDEAIEELDHAIENGYKTVSVYRLRGDLLASKQDLESAKLDYANALQCEPITDQHWMDRGLILLGSNPAMAADNFQSALKTNPFSVAAHQKLAYVYSELLNKPDKSLEHSDRLVELLPSDPTHLAGRAVLHARSNRTKEAVADVRRLESMPLRDPMVIYQVACIHSLLAGAAPANGLETQLHAKSAFQWYIKAVNAEPGIVPIALTDPDVQWMRQQPQFQEIANAINTLKLTPPSS